MKYGRFAHRFSFRVLAVTLGLAIVGVIVLPPSALAKARVVAIVPLVAGTATKASADHFTELLVARLASYPGFDAVRLSAGQEPQESAAKLGAEVYIVGEFDKKGDLLAVSLESFNVVTNQFIGNLVVVASDLDVPAKIDFSPLFGKSDGTVPTPAPMPTFDPIAMQSAATPPASLEASPEPTPSAAASPVSKPAPAAHFTSSPAKTNRPVQTSAVKPQPKASSKPSPPPKPTPKRAPKAAPTPQPHRSEQNRAVSPIRVPQPKTNAKPLRLAAAKTPAPPPAPIPTETPTATAAPTSSPTPAPTAPAPIAAKTRSFTLIPLQAPDADSNQKSDPLLDQSTLDLSRRLAAMRYSVSIGPTKDRDEASRDAATMCRDANSGGILLGTMKYELKRAGLNRLINKNATDSVQRVTIRLTLLDCAGKFVWKAESIKNLAEIPKPTSGDPDVVSAALSELVGLFETRP